MAYRTECKPYTAALRALNKDFTGGRITLDELREAAKKYEIKWNTEFESTVTFEYRVAMNSTWRRIHAEEYMQIIRSQNEPKQQEV